MYIGSGTVQVSAVIELHGESDIVYDVQGNQVEFTGRGTERFAETLNQALAELHQQRQ
jgi:hypothetical protein